MMPDLRNNSILFVLFLSKNYFDINIRSLNANLVFRIHSYRIYSEIIFRSFDEVGNYIFLDDPIQMHTICCFRNYGIQIA